MRVLSAKDIFPRIYSIVNGEIIKNSNGEYYNKQVAEHILKNKIALDDEELKRLIKFDEEQLNKNVVKYFRNRHSMLLSSENGNVNLLELPNKRFEIFTLDTLGGKIVLAEATDLPNGDDRDLYYRFEIANEIYQKLIDIRDSSFNDYEDIQYIYQREIQQNESDISDLKIKDNEIFENDMIAYNLISKTSLYEKYRLLTKDKEYLIKENERLNKTISEYNEKITDLSQKLKISFDRIHFLLQPKTFWDKLKNLFKDDKTVDLLEDIKGEE